MQDCRHSWLLKLAVLPACALAFALPAEEAKPAKPKLPDEVEKAFGAFVASAREARKPIAAGELDKLCNEVAKSVQLTDEQRKQLEAEAQASVEEACDKFAEKLDAWLRPFLVGYGDHGLTNLSRWKPEQFASRSNVASSPQDAKAWEAAVHKVLNPEQMEIYRKEVGDKTARRKREIANYLKDALVVRRNQLAEAFRLEREGIVRELSLEKDRAARLETGEKDAVNSIVAEDEKTAADQLLALNEESWRQMYGSGGMHQFETGSSRGPVTKRESWTKVLASVLTPEELKRWDNLLGRRQERRERAAAMGAVAELEDKVLLSAEQRRKLEPIFLERWRRYPSNDNNQIYPMNLLRSGSDAEITGVLTTAQQKRWSEFVRGGYGNGRLIEPPAPAAPAKMGGPPQPVDTERIFATYLVKVYHEQRDRMMSSMQEQVDELTRVTGISGDSLRLAQVAARGAVERVLDSGWRTSVENNARGSVEGVGAQFLKQRLDSMGDSRFRVEEPESQAIWRETLRQVLTAQQQQDYEKVARERVDYRHNAIVQIILAQLDSSLRISGDQGDRLEPLLTTVVADYWPDYQRSFSGSNYAIYPYYLPVFLAGVPEKDRKSILTGEQLKQFEGDVQSRYNGWWDNIRRQHDQRVKTRAK